MNKMWKFLLSLVTVLVFVVYILESRKPQQSITTPSAGIVSLTPSPQAALSLKDGSYTGDVTDAYYGNVQIRATISSGKITNVEFLQYPNDRSTSVAINSQAMPLLKQEAISAQTAQVDIVTGATQTSMAFKASLQSALNQAQ